MAKNLNMPMFDRGYLRAPWTDFDVIGFKMTARTSSFQRYQNVQKRISRKTVTRQTMERIFPKIPDATIVYNVLMPTKSDLDGQEKIEIFKIGVRDVRG